ncbi:alpha/beta hydrolase [Merismopedia glauca]|uniref:Uncharacterized protein n=1 Tax=Merismopedia glauca CCAP 1448/3 TaxID=1296344 RepID=A0A2T1C037_9CYAN|nr:alpha/beta hydrolase [Merismopedia glauca]PSB01636.1 hypothetical protein C7B64_17320 [Merismopedia glauca CCAP 1448/3]
MTFDTPKLQQLLKQALSAEDLNELCSTYFPEVYAQFTNGQVISHQRRLLLEYAQRHREIPKLLAAVREINPTVYQEFFPELETPPQPPTTPTNPAPNPLPETQTCDILVLSANPLTTDPLQLEQEAELIQQRLQEGDVGKKYLVKAQRAVQATDISKYLLQYQPLILHFSGHGHANGDIIFNNSQGQPQSVSPSALAELLAAIPSKIECVFLNACFSLAQADALSEQVSCVIGMSQEIDDESAIRFAAGFYRGLGFGSGYYRAFQLGINEINLLQLPDSRIPHFISRDTSILEEQTVKPRVTRSFTPQSTTATLYPLWFGTNRQPINPQDITQGFSGKRDNQLHYGTCQVAVPKSHQIGSTGSSSWWQRLLNLESDRLKLDYQTLAILSSTDFWTNIQHTLQAHPPDERSALVFIHGFNVTFTEAAQRAAQIGYDLQVPGIMAFYSWASQGKLTGYTADEATIEASEKYIAEFLVNLAEHSGVTQIHIIAHSMGNRGLLRAMQRILAKVQTQTQISFGQIFLAAPDVDPDLFQDLAQAYHQLAERTTLYISSQDKALGASGIIHDYPRVGFFPPITVVEGIDTVEVSHIDLTWLGHGYFADARPLLADMHGLLRHNTSPDDRFGMESVLMGSQKYWRIKG